MQGRYHSPEPCQRPALHTVYLVKLEAIRWAHVKRFVLVCQERANTAARVHGQRFEITV